VGLIIGIVVCVSAIASEVIAAVLSVGIQVTCKINSVSVLEYRGRAYGEEPRIVVPLRPRVRDAAEFFGAEKISVLNNKEWILSVSLVEAKVRDVALAGGEIMFFIGQKETQLASRPISVASGRKGAFSLRLKLRAVTPPEARGSTGGRWSSSSLFHLRFAFEPGACEEEDHRLGLFYDFSAHEPFEPGEDERRSGLDVDPLRDSELFPSFFDLIFSHGHGGTAAVS
jgi:hypothetical protein